MALAQAKLAAADLVILVFENRGHGRPPMPPCASAWPNALVVYNKCDLAAGEQTTDARPAGLRVSATQPAGLSELIAAIGQRLVPAPPIPGDAVPFTTEQIEQLEWYRATVREVQRNRHTPCAVRLRNRIS